MSPQFTPDRETILRDAAIAHTLKSERANQGRTLTGGERHLYEQRTTAAYMQGITASEIRTHAATLSETP
ncbi:hypothetical protein [Streptomyces sp. NPDC085596]|uniref:hypothetical protein n=1 Tax=Streptomyces sp. NPDC085596 TaxID=3365731 RepID=UPI0037D0786B